MRRVVIGAAYGDEGKGNVVNAISNRETLVVRFNGGAQAGHTVCHEGRRHIFSHFGAGTLKGARTHLMSDFVCFPRLFMKEMEELHPLIPQVTVSPDCQLTTPFDVWLNRAAEKSRSHAKHGSVGIGFGETVCRGNSGYGIAMHDLTCGRVHDKLINIRDRWVPARCDRLNIPYRARPKGTDIDLDAIVEAFIAFRDHVRVCSDKQALAHEDDVVFEGAQGLMLDAVYGTFPYVTHSRTGLTNLHARGIDYDEVLFVTRAYTTRHGAGPFPHELPEPPYSAIVDETNKPNGWQGPLRYSYLNLAQLAHAVAQCTPRGAKTTGVMTCLDQLPERVKWLDAAAESGPRRRLPDRYRRAIGAAEVYVTDGEAATGLYQNEQLQLIA